MTYKRKLIEVALPLDAISKASAGEKSIRQGHPATLHQWWARRPLVAARAVLWASLVDDPSAHPDRFPTDETQALERRRLFDILEKLVLWKNSNASDVLAEARAEIEASCEGELPSVLDPFCGGGAIPVEAQRLGLPAYGSDLNPVAVLISKALVEIPPRFEGLPPVNPDARNASGLKTWERAQGLADDIGFYGEWMRERAFERIGHLYPTVRLPESEGGGEGTVIAWIWARTVRSPDPSWGGHVPLVRSWILRRAKGAKPVVWAEPIVDRATRKVSYRIRTGGKPPPGTHSRTASSCIATGTPIPKEYIKSEASEGRLGAELTAVVAKGRRSRVYLSPGSVPKVGRAYDVPSARLSDNSRYMVAPLYGLTTTDSMFTDRQSVALCTFSDLLDDVHQVVEEHARSSHMVDDRIRLRDSGSGAVAYADAIVTFLAFAIDKLVDLNNSLVPWGADVQCPRHLFSRQAIPMVWDYAEANPLGSSSGSWKVIIDGIRRAFQSKGWPSVRFYSPAAIEQQDAVNSLLMKRLLTPLVCTDPPYYDNVPYADLSDFFYVWLRRNLSDIWPDETATLLTPKSEELVADSHRSQSKQAAKMHFENGMTRVIEQIAGSQSPRFPSTMFYAFKQQETKKGSTASTGWETFLQGVVDAGMRVTATWPIRTETRGRLRAIGSSALAASIVIACRPRSANAPLATRRELLDALQAELPGAVRLLRDQAIAPVDMAQSAIGPGMEIFSRYAKVLEADGTPMPVRTALTLINEALEEALSSEETEFDGDTRWALTWYEQFGHDRGPFGDAETLAKAKNTSVEGVVRAGVAESQAGKVRLLARERVDDGWDPTKDSRLTVWKVAQQLAARLEHGEAHAAELLRAVGGGVGDRARRLSYLLYQIADSKGRSEDAVAYNGLVQTWHDIARLAASRGTVAQTLEGI